LKLIEIDSSIVLTSIKLAPIEINQANFNQVPIGFNQVLNG